MGLALQFFCNFAPIWYYYPTRSTRPLFPGPSSPCVELEHVEVRLVPGPGAVLGAGAGGHVVQLLAEAHSLGTVAQLPGRSGEKSRGFNGIKQEVFSSGSCS